VRTWAGGKFAVETRARALVMGKLWLRLSRRVNLTTQKHSTLRSGGGRNIRRYHFAWIDDPIEGSDQGQFASRWFLALPWLEAREPK